MKKKIVKAGEEYLVVICRKCERTIPFFKIPDPSVEAFEKVMEDKLPLVCQKCGYPGVYSPDEVQRHEAKYKH